MAVSGDHRRNIRPYILGICFFWGLVIGFSAYLYMKTAAQRLEIIEVEEKKEQQKKDDESKNAKVEIEQIDPFKTTEEVEEPPEFSNVLAKPEVKLIEEKIIEPNFREPPVVLTPSIEDMPGLSGLTVSRPGKPEEPAVNIEKAPPGKAAAPVRKKNPFADESVVLDDVAPPELDD